MIHVPCQVLRHKYIVPEVEMGTEKFSVKNIANSGLAQAWTEWNKLDHGLAMTLTVSRCTCQCTFSIPGDDTDRIFMMKDLILEVIRESEGEAGEMTTRGKSIQIPFPGMVH